MPAITVFAVLRAGRERRSKERADIMMDLTRVAMAPRMNEQGLNALRSYFEVMRHQYSPPGKRPPAKPTFEKDTWTINDWKQATDVMASQLKIKKRLEGHG